MRNALQLASAFILLFALAGCSTTPEASREKDADAKRFEPAMRAATIYLYRPDIRGGVATIWIDNRLIGQTVSGTYFRVPVRAGRNVITASGSDLGRIAIETKEEGVYFVEMRVHGEDEGSSTTVFRSVASEAGQKALAQCCTLLENWRPGQPRFGIFNF